MTNRQRLPNRRQVEIMEFELSGVRYRATFGRHADGTLAEIFIDLDNPCSDLAIAAHDLAIAASLAMQFGCPADVLRKALQRLSDGSGAGPLAAALDLIAEGAP
jgi:hypothetical protein